MTKSTSPGPDPVTGAAASTGGSDSHTTGHDDPFTDRDVFDRPEPLDESRAVERTGATGGVRV